MPGYCTMRKLHTNKPAPLPSDNGYKGRWEKVEQALQNRMQLLDIGQQTEMRYCTGSMNKVASEKLSWCEI